VNDLQEILRSPIKTSINIDDEQLLEMPNSTRRNRRQTFSQSSSSFNNASTSSYGGKKNHDLIGSSDDIDIVEDVRTTSIGGGNGKIVSLSLKSLEHVCGICGDIFGTRERLLEHVSIHI
jgi:hypothetical protein